MKTKNIVRQECVVRNVALGGLLAAVLYLTTPSASATVRYVDASSANPAPPYTNWATAARVIQQAVDAAAPGDKIVVTNGLYATGGRTVGTNLLVNRVAVTKPVTLRSVNGPDVTVIQGYQVPGTINGDAAIRCVYLANGALLAGFTLIHGATQTSGDYQTNQSGGGVWCEALTAVVSNCVLTGNSAVNYGGGACNGSLNNCVLTGNSANIGGGASSSTLNNCVLTGNSAGWVGGGASGGTLSNCTLTGNSADYGGGADGGTLNNCIVYYNNARSRGANYNDYSSFNYCCTTPLPAGPGNLDEEPQLASAWRPSVFSPCRGAGNAAYATGFDIDGEPWANPPSMGCDEYRAGALTGPLTLSLKAAYTNVAVGFPVALTAWIEGRPTLSVWDFDDGDFALDQPWTTHTWTAPGDYVVALWAFNETHPEGVNTTLTVHVLPQPVHYVAPASGNPLPPYLSWATAATNIQDAVDAATIPGALVLVANGVYATGGRAAFGSRVAVDKPLTVRSVNGPANTIIQGYQVTGTNNGDAAICCAYLANGAVLAGFTLTNGAGGVSCEGLSAVVSNCVLTGNSAELGGAAYSGTLNNCVLTGNSADYEGGGADYCTLNNCVLTANSAFQGGGAAESTLNNCVLTGNSAGWGGGAAWGTLNNCTLSDNSAELAGGAYASTLKNCVLTGNSADEGGGACGGTLYNCTLTDNSARTDGGGVWGARGDMFGPRVTLNNCTLTGNAASSSGGGVSGGTLNNCIVYYNTAPSGANYCYCTLNYCCTTPQPQYGTNNITLGPQLLDTAHLSPSSPCRGAGSATYATGTDIDGERWGNPPSIGCDEYYPGPATGPLRVTVTATFTNVLTGYSVGLTALIEGHASLSVWDFGDGQMLTNQLYASHAWAALGDYPVALRAYNASNPGGVSATVAVHVVAQPVHYVAAGNVTPVPPYTSWATAATNIQDAVDAADVASFPPGSVLVLVSNGVYRTGGRAVVGTMTNRVVVDRLLTVRSVNGPQFTVIEGYKVPGTTNGCGDGAIRCVYLSSGASLDGFTLTKGATRGSWTATLEDDQMGGGGVWCEPTVAVLTNCVVVGNSAGLGAGGVSRGTLNQCIIATNSSIIGGGAWGSTLNYCTLTGNSGWEGGGATSCTLNRCTLSGNRAIGDIYGAGGAAAGSTLYYCTLSGNTATRFGGGSRYCVLSSCTLTDNSAAYGGGGAYEGILDNCTLTGNSAGRSGGGGEICTLNNCISYFNTAPQGANYFQEMLDAAVTVNYCCITPIPTNGVGNITNAPRFVDYANGNLHLRSNSPCINAGNNSILTNPQYDWLSGGWIWVTNLLDLDGNPRIVSGTVDIGAYEYQGTGSIISYAWLQQYGLSTDGSADYADPDHDGLNTWQEWRCQTDPTNTLSALRLLSATPAGTNVTLTWQSVAGVNYFVERSTNLWASPPFTLLAPGLPGQPGATTYTDTNAAGLAPLFYRVSVGN
jgi:hypothetical protein